MDKLINRTKKLIFTKQGGIISSTLILSGMILLSRFMGFFRYRILTDYFNKYELDVFFAAFRIPDLIFEILITGALTSTLIPLFIKYQDNSEELEINLSSIINLISIALGFFIVILFIFMPGITEIIVNGFSLAQKTQIVLFSRLLLLSQLPFLMWGNFLTGLAQANKSYFITALAPIFYNLSAIIITILFSTQLSLFAPILGVIIGAILFFVIQLPILGIFKFHYHFLIRSSNAIKEFVVLIIPRVLTVINTQIDATIDLALSSLLGGGAYTTFYLAQHLQLLPVSVVGIAFGQAALPYLSEMYQKKQYIELKNLIVNSILNLFFLTIPIAVFFIFARTPLVRLFFGAQKFDWDATVLTAYTLSYFAFSIPFHASYYLITRCFYAMLDSRTPFIISLISIVINTGLSLIFVLVFHLPVWSLSLSFSISIIFNVMLLLLMLQNKTNGFPMKTLSIDTLKIGFSAFVPAVIVYFTMKLMDGLIFDTSRTLNLFLLIIFSACLYFLLYFFIAWLLNIKELGIITKFIIKTKQYQKKILEVYVSNQS